MDYPATTSTGAEGEGAIAGMLTVVPTARTLANSNLRGI